MKKVVALVSASLTSLYYCCGAFQSTCAPLGSEGALRVTLDHPNKRRTPVFAYNSFYDDESEDLADFLRISSSSSQPQREAPTSAPSSFGYGYREQLDESDHLTEFLSIDVATEEEEAASQVYSLRQVPVKFVNFNPNNPYDYRSAVVDQGTNLMKLADELGVPIPRNCKSGICGSCVSDLVDPTWQSQPSQPGRQTIRLCSVGAVLPAECEEMVIDCFRNGVISSSKEQLDSPRRVDAVAVDSDRFRDNWESEYQPDWAKKSESKVGMKSVPTGRIDIDLAPSEDLAVELAKVVKGRSKRSSGRRLPLSGSPNFRTGRMYAWYRGNIKVCSKSRRKDSDWTFHDIDRSLGGVYNPDVADGVAPWDRIW